MTSQIPNEIRDAALRVFKEFKEDTSACDHWLERANAGDIALVILYVARQAESVVQSWFPAIHERVWHLSDKRSGVVVALRPVDAFNQVCVRWPGGVESWENAAGLRPVLRWSPSDNDVVVRVSDGAEGRVVMTLRSDASQVMVRWSTGASWERVENLRPM